MNTAKEATTFALVSRCIRTHIFPFHHEEKRTQEGGIDCIHNEELEL